jgi:flavin-dependent dehydrogenase
LDEALLDHAGRAGAKIERGVAVNSVQPVEEGLALDIGGEELHTRTLLLATGKTELRGLARDSGQTSDLVGFKSHYRLEASQTAALSRAVELHLFDGGYAGLQLIEGQIANLCLLIERNRVANARGSWDQILGEILAAAPILGDRLSGAEMLFDRALTVSSLPYGYLFDPNPDDPPGVIRLGDQFAVLHSFTGEGMALATASAGILAGVEVRGYSDSTYLHHQLRRQVIRPLRLSAVMHHLIRQPYGRLLLTSLAGVLPGVLATAARLTRVRH